MDRVSRAEAARMLNIDKSTLTRWIQKHPALLGDDGMVDVVELREHRDAVANPKLQTRGAAARGAAAAPPQGQSGSGGAAAVNDHRARGEAAKAITAELDLAERLKLTLVRSDVESQIAQAGEVLKRKAAELAKNKAEALSRIEDPRAMERALDDLMRQLLEQGATALILAMAPPVEQDSDAA